MTTPIRIAMLNADVPVPNVLPTWSTYGRMFHDLLAAAASRIAPDVHFASTDYDVKSFEYPESLSEVDAILITGSASSSYDDQEWIRRLDDYVLEVYLNYPHVKMFGSCFGHQLICQSLLRGYGVRVEKDPKGWELGVKQIRLEEQFRRKMGKTSKALLRPDYSGDIPEDLRVQFVHADYVAIPSIDALPRSWLTVGSTQHCAVQGVYQPGRILTLQGHFEFNRFVNTEIMKVFGASWNPEVLKEVFESIDADDDAERAAEMILQFLMEKETEQERTTRGIVGGLLTPPQEE